MELKNYFGALRSLEPKGSLPQPAWKLDNSMELKADEVLVDVKIVCINRFSFNEILDEAGEDDKAFAKYVLRIIKERGKLHNPVTGTGGMLYGKVKQIGKKYPNVNNIKVGDEIISLASLTITPITIERIHYIDYENAQIYVEGQCVLFSNTPLILRPSNILLQLAITAMDEAGAPMRTNKIVSRGQNVLILGAYGKMGILCAHAAREKLGATGKLVGLIKCNHNLDKLEQMGIFDEIITMDITKCYQKGFDINNITADYDIVINCINSINTEAICLLFVKDGGVVYFSTLNCDSKMASLTAESIGKEVTLIPYTGFMKGHAEFTLLLLQKYETLRNFFSVKTPKQVQKKDHDINKAYESNSYDMDIHYNYHAMGYIFESQQSKEVLNKAIKVAKYDSPVIIFGESGVGKEIIAQIIHQNSDRKIFPLIKINCAAIPEHLFESELFGYEKGAFTGANDKGKIGFWEAAQNGTLFLDEIGELTLHFQSKILRAIQEKEIIRIGGVTPIKVNTRIVAATNKDLLKMVEENKFREDLYYRLTVVPITVPPLRKRKKDIIALINYFTEKYNKEFNVKKQFSEEALKYMEKQPFYGNVRELQNIVQRLIVLSNNQIINIKDVLHNINIETSLNINSQDRIMIQDESDFEYEQTLQEIIDETEKTVIMKYKEKYGSTRKVAEALAVSQPTIVRKCHKHRIDT